MFPRVQFPSKPVKRQATPQLQQQVLNTINGARFSGNVNSSHTRSFEFTVHPIGDQTKDGMRHRVHRTAEKDDYKPYVGTKDWIPAAVQNLFKLIMGS